MIRNTIEKFKGHREVCYRKKKNSGNISMKNNGKDIPSLASIAKNNDKKINLIQHVGDNCCAV